MYGMVYKTGCVPGIDVAHIKSFGGGSTPMERVDVLENVIGLCRKHHQDHEAGIIKDLTLQLILYHFYGYGPDSWLAELLYEVEEMAQDHGVSVSFHSEDGKVIHCEYLGMTTRFSDSFTVDLAGTTLKENFLTMLETTIITQLRLGG